jgi:hypothetical protein
MTDTIGNANSKAAIVVLRLLSSLTLTMIKAEIRVLMANIILSPGWFELDAA